jgi:hypothetical protein
MKASLFLLFSVTVPTVTVVVTPTAGTALFASITVFFIAVGKVPIAVMTPTAARPARIAVKAVRVKAASPRLTLIRSRL